MIVYKTHTWTRAILAILSIAQSTPLVSQESVFVSSLNAYFTRDKFARRDSFSRLFLPSGQPASRITDLQHERLLQHVPAPMKLTLIAFIAHCLIIYGVQSPISYLVEAYKFTITGPNSYPRRLVWVIIRADNVPLMKTLNKVKLYIENYTACPAIRCPAWPHPIAGHPICKIYR